MDHILNLSLKFSFQLPKTFDFKPKQKIQERGTDHGYPDSSKIGLQSTQMLSVFQSWAKTLGKYTLDSDRFEIGPANHVIDWDDLYFDYLEYVAEKPVVYGKTIY